MRRLAWFSCGASSAVVAKLAVEAYGDECEVVSCDTREDEHPDNYRFSADVERWIGRPIRYIRSTNYANVDDVFERRRYMAGIKGAACTTQLKKLPRVAFQYIDDVHLFGFTADEQGRADDFEEKNPGLRVEWVLIERGIDKDACLRMVAEAGIALPVMYGLDYEHNNCLGCVKATSPRYWNKIRRDFPEVFEKRARQSRSIGARLVRVRLPSDPPSKNAARHFLDELPADATGPREQIDCGPACQMPLFGEAAQC